jgi:putative ABC transport system substrate-binding protein
MKRREFLAVLGGAAAWTLTARAQQVGRMRRVGALMAFSKSDSASQSSMTAFLQGLQNLGWSEGRNVQIDYRWADGGFEQMLAFAKELVALQPDVIVAFNGAPVVTALSRETRTIPIVFTGVSDPVGLGLVENMARPGGNITGLSTYESSLGTKWLDALKQVAPAVRRVALLFNPLTSVPALYMPSIQAAAGALGVDLAQVSVGDVAEIEPAVAALAREPGGGLMLLPDNFLIAHRKLIVGLAARYRVPAVYSVRWYTDEGGLMAYGIDVDDMNRRAATYVDRILKGEKAADLPVQQPTKFDLVINMKTAKTLGLTVPASLLASADEVIE